MSARHDIQRRLQTLGEIRDILSSMKVLATMETRKLERLLANQQEQVTAIETMADDLLAHYPGLLPAVTVPEQNRFWVLVGSERGFCGDFNEALLRQADADGLTVGRTVVVGSRLAARIGTDEAPAAVLDGAGAGEAVRGTIDALTRVIASLQKRHGGAVFGALYHDTNGSGLRRRALLPPFTDLAPPPRRFRHAPLLNVKPDIFFSALLDQYLFAALHEILFTSLRSENLRRMRHLDAAVRHLEDKRTELARRGRSLRQEEIVEEIEVILLSAETPRLRTAAS